MQKAWMQQKFLCRLVKWIEEALLENVSENFKMTVLLSTNDLDEAIFWHGGLSVFTKNWMQTFNAKDHENRFFTILLYV